MGLVITIRNPHDPRQAFGYFDNSVRGFSTDERRAMRFNDMDKASVALQEVRIRFPRIAHQTDVRIRPDQYGRGQRGATSLDSISSDNMNFSPTGCL